MMKAFTGDDLVLLNRVKELYQIRLIRDRVFDMPDVKTHPRRLDMIKMITGHQENVDQAADDVATIAMDEADDEGEDEVVDPQEEEKADDQKTTTTTRAVDASQLLPRPDRSDQSDRPKKKTKTGAPPGRGQERGQKTRPRRSKVRRGGLPKKVPSALDCLLAGPAGLLTAVDRAHDSFYKLLTILDAEGAEVPDKYAPYQEAALKDRRAAKPLHDALHKLIHLMFQPPQLDHEDQEQADQAVVDWSQRCLRLTNAVCLEVSSPESELKRPLQRALERHERNLSRKRTRPDGTEGAEGTERDEGNE